MDWLFTYLISFWDLLVEMAPWLMLGFLFSGLLKVYFPQHKIKAYLGKSGFRSNLNAAIVGVPLPLCSCGVIPAGISLHQNGASKGATNSFLISTPQTGIDSILASYALLGWPLALMRPMIAFVTGVFGGFVTDSVVQEKQVELSSQSHSDLPNLSTKEKILTVFRYGFVEMLADIAKWLLIGLLLAALLSVLLPNDFFANAVNNLWLELLLVLLISIPLYVCATGSIPIALVLLLKGLSPGAAILFLMAGPATNIATITVLSRTLGKKSLMAYLLAIIGGAIFFAILINTLIPADWLLSTVPNLTMETHAHGFALWFSTLCAIILLTLILYSLFIPFFKRNQKIPMNLENIQTIKVNGMSCNHCKLNVENNLKKLKNVELVEADWKNNLVRVKGTANRQVILDTINQLGYQALDD